MSNLDTAYIAAVTIECHGKVMWQDIEVNEIDDIAEILWCVEENVKEIREVLNIEPGYPYER